MDPQLRKKMEKLGTSGMTWLKLKAKVKNRNAIMARQATMITSEASTDKKTRGMICEALQISEMPQNWTTNFPQNFICEFS